MPALSADAADTIQLVRELRLLDEGSIRLLEQLFTNRLDADLVTSLISGKEDVVAVALFRVCTGAHTPRILGYALRFLADLVFADKTLAEQFGRSDLSERFGANPATTFLRCCTSNRDSLAISNPATYMASIALCYGDYKQNEDAFATFFSLANHVLSADTLHVADVEFTVYACVQLARRKSLRHLFFEANMVQHIPHLLTDIVSSDSASIIQLIYEILQWTWLLSFEYRGIVQLAEHSLIPQLHRVLQRVQKEKCVRAALMTLWNMVTAEKKYLAYVLNHSSGGWEDASIELLGHLHSGKLRGASTKGPSLIAEMVGVGVLKTLSQLCSRKFGDEDIGNLVLQLHEALEKSMDMLTSFSEYRGEILSGTLEWTAVHTSEKFWRENATKFEEDQYEVLNALGKLILDSHNDLTLSVACHDLGEVVRYHPSGRNLLNLSTMAGVKERVLSLMSNPNPEIAKEALLCTQKIMVQRWEYVQQDVVS